MSLVVRPDFPKGFAVFDVDSIHSKATILFEGTKEDCDKKLKELEEKRGN
jgi:hypothetical protein